MAFWDNLVWSTQLLLWTRTRSPVYRARVRAFLDDWRLGRTVRALASAKPSFRPYKARSSLINMPALAPVLVH